jgi:hypothetical protein
MQKLLLILISITLIFSSCEKEEEEIQTNNNNNITDVIVGDWSEIGGDINLVRHLNFYSNNTYEDYYVLANGNITDDFSGTWQNLGDGEYSTNSFGDIDTFMVNFYCEDNVVYTPFSQYIYADYRYWTKNNFDYQSCSEINP